MKNLNFMKTSVLVITLGVSAVFFTMLRPYMVAILMAAISAGLSYPLYSRLTNLFGGRRRLASALTLFVVLALVILPGLGILGLAADQAVDVSRAARPWIEEQLSKPDPLAPLLDRFNVESLGIDREEMLTKAAAAIQNLGSFFVNRVAGATSRTVLFLFQFFLYAYSMYFFLLDGRKILQKWLYYLPLRHEDEMFMISRFSSVSRAMVKGTLIIGGVQGLLGGLGFAVAGIPGSVFFGVVMVVLSIIPGVGTALVWIPAVISLLIMQKIATAVLLTLWFALVVGTVDNILRPVLVGRDTKMHELVILFSTLGGLSMFGVSGLLLGPLLAAAFLTLWDIYGSVFAEDLPEAGPAIDEMGRPEA